MNIVVLNTGTELLLGRVLNTHLTFIAREIFPLGLRVARQETVSDGPAIGKAIAATFAEADVVLVTGGLGPTTDDITREAAAELLGLEMAEDATVAEAITERMRTRGFELTDRILRQAQVPTGALVLPNANGTAPGLYLASRNLQSGRSPHLFLLPGPPRELQPMFRDSVLPILRKLAPSRAGIEARTFRLACVGESLVEKEVGPQLLALPEVELGYCARMGEVDVRVLAPAASLAAAEKIMRAAYPLQLFTEEDEELEAAVVRMLKDKGARVATAESCTGGYLAHRLTNVPGASAVFAAGFVPYANEAKTRELGVGVNLIAEYGAVSEEVARAMAAGAQRRTGAQYALATTGIAGPTGGSEAKPVGTVFIALASATGESVVWRRLFLAERSAFKHLATQHALQLLREHLLAQ